MTDPDKEALMKALRHLNKTTLFVREEPEHAIGQMLAASRRKGGRRKAQRRGK